MISSNAGSGKPLQARSLNISPGGIALKIPGSAGVTDFKKGKVTQIRIRIPGSPFVDCQGVVCHITETMGADLILGIRFKSIPKEIQNALIQMSLDNEACDRRIREHTNPWCSRSCGYYHLCRKPIRTPEQDTFVSTPFEISF